MLLKKLFKNTKTPCFVYRIQLQDYMDEYFYTLLIDRRNQSIEIDRKLILLVLNSKNLEEIINIKKVEKSDLFINPLPLIEFYDFSLDKIPWENIDMISVDISIISNWAFKKHMAPSGVSNEVMMKEPWSISKNDSGKIRQLIFQNKWANLDFYDFYYCNYSVNFRVALELCRLKDINYERGIKDFNKKLEEDYLHRVIVNHVQFVDIYQNIPDELKGKFDESTAIPYVNIESVVLDYSRKLKDPFQPNIIPEELYQTFKKLTKVKQLNELRNHYPFDRWKEAYLDDSTLPYNPNIVNEAINLIDMLIKNLEELGLDATTEDKTALFEPTVKGFNRLNESCNEHLIDTMEREELCTLFDLIGVAFKMDFTDYDIGDGIAANWREW